MNTQQRAERTALHTRLLALIENSRDGTRDDATRDALLSALFDYQRRWVAPYAHFSAQQKRAYPALPCDAFRFARISSRAPEDDLRRFHSSGTTQAARSEHAFADLALYDAAAEAAARHMLFPDRERMQLVVLAPSADALVDSSLSYMLTRFQAWFGTPESQHVWPIDDAEVTQLVRILDEASEAQRPVALLGTSFAFVHALDALAGRRFKLASGSRIMQTGGFKGRTREVAPEAMRAALGESFGVPAPYIVAEYGMTELSSQLYETTLRAATRGAENVTRRLWSPPWLRVTVVDPEHLTPLPDGHEGLVRLDDAANLDSVCALQTADLGIMEAGELVLCGRAQGAVARGCSISADDLLQRGR